ncbi:hypothetical protein LQF12_09640 [Ruania suaedae]|uniref:hypothetical protein n=1 Tax=Ruania suaedae TaxID=2897774 RepID=UPI001E44D744|nr:hypothetical protein [Ruania suaedae]UFU01782.1 hypothetical protein LQF12_09640 [Ruania suaedae]
MRRFTALAAGLALVAALAGCTGEMEIDSGPSSPPPEPRPAATAQVPGGESMLVTGEDAAPLAVATSRELFTTARAVVLAPATDEAAIARAASVAIALGTPVLLTGEDNAEVGEELLRLSTTTLLPVGEVTLDGIDLTSMNVQAVPAETDAAGELLGIDVADAPTGAGSDVEALAELERGGLLAGPEGVADASGHMPALLPGETVEGVQVLADGAPGQLAAVGIARAAGSTVTILEGDPRASAAQLAELEPAEAILGLGSSFSDPETFRWQAETALSGRQLPGGGQLVFDGARYVGLYGTPHTDALGVLGEQGTSETVERAAELAGSYQAHTEDVVVPTLEIIVTVASTSAGSDGNYSNEWPAEGFLPLVEAAAEAGQYVLLDFQSGRTEFVEQVQQYEELLAHPHVGIALDPEWRLTDDQLPGEQIGSVSAAEVNDVITYVADFTREQRLPQKIVMLHQFRTGMITDRQDLLTTRPEVEIVIHADGFGTPQLKQDTWDVVREDAPENIHWGWKVFYDEDDPRMSPAEVMDIEPTPAFVSYQ